MGGCHSVTGERYSPPAIFFHWLQAALVLWLLWLGWTMIDLPKGAERSAAYALHKSLGLLAFGILALRLVWRRFSPAPELIATGWEARLARAAHRALYGFLVLAPVTGYLASAFTPYALKFFGIELPRIAPPDESMNGAFRLLHQVLVWGGAGLVGLHSVAALVHGLRGDGTLARMLPSVASRN